MFAEQNDCYLLQTKVEVCVAVKHDDALNKYYFLQTLRGSEVYNIVDRKLVKKITRVNQKSSWKHFLPSSVSLSCFNGWICCSKYSCERIQCGCLGIEIKKRKEKEKCIQNVAEGEHADRVTIKVQRYSTNHERKRKRNQCVNIAINNLYSTNHPSVIV